MRIPIDREGWGSGSQRRDLKRVHTHTHTDTDTHTHTHTWQRRDLKRDGQKDGDVGDKIFREAEFGQPRGHVLGNFHACVGIGVWGAAQSNVWSRSLLHLALLSSLVSRFRLLCLWSVALRKRAHMRARDRVHICACESVHTCARETEQGLSLSAERKRGRR